MARRQMQLLQIPKMRSWKKRLQEALRKLKERSFNDKDQSGKHLERYTVTAGYWFSSSTIRGTLLKAGVIEKIGRLDNKFLATEFGARIARHVGGPLMHNLWLYRINEKRFSDFSQHLQDTPLLVSRHGEGPDSGRIFLVPKGETMISPDFEWYEEG